MKSCVVTKIAMLHSTWGHLKSKYLLIDRSINYGKW